MNHARRIGRRLASLAGRASFLLVCRAALPAVGEG
jgi:hypothetical protein